MTHENEQYKLEPSQEEGWWVLTDKFNLVVLKFKQGDFNRSQKITFLEDSELNSMSPGQMALKCAGIVGGMGEFAAQFPAITTQKKRLRIEEAIARANHNGKKIKKGDLAARIFAGTSEKTQSLRMTQLIKGDLKKVDPDWVIGICEMCGVSADFLFGLSND